MNQIKLLPAHEARRLAAGEVIERPASALRELIDNAIDAKAKQITIHLKHGGIEEITIIDDGLGILPDDLPLTIVSHATSKIQRVEDLDRLQTLGFRGEALASLATCAKLEITSKHAQSDAHQLLAHDGVVESIKPSAHPVGTTIRVRELFYTIPVRKRFLKSSTAEARESTQVVYEKALAHPQIGFTLFLDGKQKLQLPSQSLAARAVGLYPQQLGQDPLVSFREESTDEGFSLQIISSPIHLHRTDKRYIHFYANGRRIMEYAPVQAVLHAYDKLLPGGQFPSGFIFVQIRPDLVDFNIHPAKREAKFTNLPLIHRAITQLLIQKLATFQPTIHESSLFRPITPPIVNPLPDLSHQEAWLATPPKGKAQGNASHPKSYSRIIAGDNIADFLGLTPQANPAHSHAPQAETPHVSLTASSIEPLLAQKSTLSGGITQSWYYLGQVFGVFLLVEKGDSLFLLDQHAAHERIRFEEILAQPPVVERLLTPLKIEVSPDQMLLMNLAKEELQEMGIEFQGVDEEHIELLSCPSLGQSLSFWQEYLLNLEKGIKKTLYATIACHNAIKEGEYLDDQGAIDLIKATFALAEPFCPHGRPLWIELTREQLYKWIKRIV
ncbi:DNA mismatch repair endonuclease MutL [Entomospira culicis]|uniref:DNA mismatch repair protein MutL n=1 Tax=Entomospira culicis TaxID=2719989 RepID=A0A968GFG3_9SPIO|nr:DNA mismatch repair endonuclease MutL [Entomospira culicis]NIZ18636.1 DNA mismatch repair endonuclease MutL [Entomospira culicis]NIZ68851.1 DNA mismatch repair endonuclease MutL [Entomospira culicis]WDI37445.1 DNA mismatch repair endonuclease MutL [Entomospira culicis]WDI39073.1 DNA mismatch repair endonuclease MutL [Entomospira culicis]